MRLRHLGYACINRSLELTTGRTFRLASMEPEKIEEVTRANLDALGAMLRWNAERGIHFLRVASSVVPFASHADYPIDWQERFAPELAALRELVEATGHRVTMHPGQYTVLNSPDEEIAARAIAELDYSARFLEAVAPPPDNESSITLHVGGAYGDRPAALARLARRVEGLKAHVRRRLTLENDDRVWALHEVLPACEALGLPLVFDVFHHRCLPGDRDDWRDGLREELARVVATWAGRVPKLHISSQQPGGRAGSHADRIDPTDLDELVALMEGVGGEQPYDVMVEAKHKDEAVLALMNEQHRP